MAALRVGLTGGLASGKSTVATWLAERPGFLVIDADRLVAELYGPGAAGAAAVARLLGSELLDESGAVTKAALAARIFTDPSARASIEAAIHPLVRRRFEELAARDPGIAVLEATRLFEAGYADLFDLTVSVEAPEAIRLSRAVARGLAESDARARLAAQGDGAARRDGADWILDSSGELDELRRQVGELIAELERRAFK